MVRADITARQELGGRDRRTRAARRSWLSGAVEQSLPAESPAALFAPQTWGFGAGAPPAESLSCGLGSLLDALDGVCMLGAVFLLFASGWLVWRASVSLKQNLCQVVVRREYLIVRLRLVAHPGVWLGVAGPIGESPRCKTWLEAPSFAFELQQ